VPIQNRFSLEGFCRSFSVRVVSLVAFQGLFLLACVTTTSLPIKEYTKDDSRIIDHRCGDVWPLSSMKVWQDEVFMGRMEADAQRSTDGWSIDVSDNFGRRLGFLSYNSVIKKIGYELPIDQVLNIKIMEQEIFVNDYPSGILVDELPCLSSGFIPSNWIDQSTILISEDTRILRYESGRRRISFSFDRGGAHEICGEIRRYFFLSLLYRDINVCRTLLSDRSGIIDMNFGEFRINIKALN
jgi:hypothetical protein